MCNTKVSERLVKTSKTYNIYGIPTAFVHDVYMHEGGEGFTAWVLTTAAQFISVVYTKTEIRKNIIVSHILFIYCIIYYIIL